MNKMLKRNIKNNSFKITNCANMITNSNHNLNFTSHIRRYISLYLILILLFTFTINIHYSYADEISIDSRAAIVYELNTNEILYEKNIHEKLYPASLTKFLTGLLAIENGNLNDTITFNKEATTLEPGSSTLNFTEGEKIDLSNALYGLMVRSANEVGNQLTYYIKEKTNLEYTDAANKKLKEIGANESNFISPTGLHEPNHYTTAYDLSLIAKASYENENFRKYFSTVGYTIPATNIHGEREIYSTHKMLYKSSPYYLDSLIGGKTGTTAEAGNTLITFAKKDDMLIVVVVLKGDGITEVCEDTYNLINYTFNNFENKRLLTKNEVISSIPVVNTYDIVEGYIEMKSNEDFNITISKSDNDLFTSIPEEHTNDLYTFTSSIPEKLSSSIVYGQSIGNLTLKTNTGYEIKTNIVSNNDFRLKGEETYDFTTLCTYLVIITGISLVVFILCFIKACKDEKNIDVPEKVHDKYSLTKN